MRRTVRLFVKPRKPRLLVGTLALSLSVATIACAVGMTGVGERLELWSQDQRFAKRGQIAAPSEVVVVAIDERQSTYIDQWPLSRELYANAVRNLAQAGVAGVAIDVPMDWPASEPTREDQQFLESIAGNGIPVVLARRPARDGEAAPGSGRLTDPLQGVAKHLRANLEAAPLAGVSWRGRASDGAVRKWPVRSSWEGDGEVLGLSAQLIVAAAGGNALERVPDTMLINYYGPRGTFEQVSFADAAYGLTALRDLKGRLVVIGPTDGRGRDDHKVPFAGSMSSAEIQANALANLMDGTWLRTPQAWLGWAIAGALVIAVWAMLLTLPLPVAVAGSIGAIAGWGWAGFALFDQGVVVPLVWPVVAGTATLATLSVVLAALSLRDRLRVKSLFARYVPADVVRELVDSEDRIQLGGEQREITVLFSDIRGFTSLSEHTDPEEMVAQLNDYFAAMVEVVIAYKGTLDKFLGDGLMAIFGAPSAQEDHAGRACAAALDMLERLEQVNEQRRDRGLADLRIGIGLHTGPAVVGNVGSPLFRVDFTAIGDTVNLAARLESITKELGISIAASSATAEAAAHSHEFTGHGAVVVRGRSTPTEIYELLHTRAGTMSRRAA